MPVPVEPLPDDAVDTVRLYVRMVAKLLAFINVGDVHFDDRNLDAGDGIGEGDGSVRVATGVDDGRGICIEAAFVKRVYERAFVVRLKVGQLMIRILRLQFFKVFLEGLTPVDLRLSFSEQVQVRAVDKANVHVAEGYEITDFKYSRLLTAIVSGSGV